MGVGWFGVMMLDIVGVWECLDVEISVNGVGFKGLVVIWVGGFWLGWGGGGIFNDVDIRLFGFFMFWLYVVGVLGFGWLFGGLMMVCGWGWWRV